MRKRIGLLHDLPTTEPLKFKRLKSVTQGGINVIKRICRPKWPQNMTNVAQSMTQPCRPLPAPSCRKICCEPIIPPCKPSCPEMPTCLPSCECPPICEPCVPRCNCRPHPCKPPMKPSTPYVICCGRESDRCLSKEICITGLDCCGLCPPLMLKGLEVSQSKPDVCIKRCARGPSSALAEVTIPLTAWVCDSNGRVCCGESQITVCVRMPNSCICSDGMLMASACIRLIDAGGVRCEPIFCVRLELLVEVFLVRVNPCQCKNNQCQMPSLPMFPQPHYLF